jgi:hypothetical protein
MRCKPNRRTGDVSTALELRVGSDGFEIDGCSER